MLEANNNIHPIYCINAILSPNHKYDNVKDIIGLAKVNMLHFTPDIILIAT